MLIKKKPIIGTFWETKNERERARDREGERGRGRPVHELGSEPQRRIRSELRRCQQALPQMGLSIRQFCKVKINYASL